MKSNKITFINNTGGKPVQVTGNVHKKVKTNFKCKCGYDWDEESFGGVNTSECPECHKEVEGVQYKRYRIQRFVAVTEEVEALNPVQALEDVWTKGKNVSQETILERGMPVDEVLSRFEGELSEEQIEELYDMEDREYQNIPGIWNIEEVE
jgi:hypothetical protein